MGICHSGLSKVCAIVPFWLVSALRFQTRKKPSEKPAAKSGGSFWSLKETEKHSDFAKVCFAWMD